jgi:hypothetical protein
MYNGLSRDQFKLAFMRSISVGLIAQVAIVPHKVPMRSSVLTTVASALSKQVGRDFAPIWGAEATVDAFASLNDVPTDYWPIIIMSNVRDADGYHSDRNGQPYAVVQYGDDWSLTASHECLEMLADPYGSRLKAGNMSTQASTARAPGHRVNYLVEVCDPCESGMCAYQVNGVLVSDFITPEFYDPVPTSGVRYSFTGAINAPRTILDDGYITWQDPQSDRWGQLTLFNGQAKLVNLSENAEFKRLLNSASPRSAVDAVTMHPRYSSTMPAGMTKAANLWIQAIDDGQRTRASMLLDEIAAMNKGRKRATAAPRRGRAGRRSR